MTNWLNERRMKEEEEEVEEEEEELDSYYHYLYQWTRTIWKWSRDQAV